MESGFVWSTQPSLLCSGLNALLHLNVGLDSICACFFSLHPVPPSPPFLFKCMQKGKVSPQFWGSVPQVAPHDASLSHCTFSATDASNARQRCRDLGLCGVTGRDVTGEKLKTSEPNPDPFELNGSGCAGVRGSKLVCYRCRSFKLKSRLFKRLHCFWLVPIAPHVKFYIFFHNKYMKQLIQCYIV